MLWRLPVIRGISFLTFALLEGAARLLVFPYPKDPYFSGFSHPQKSFLESWTGKTFVFL